LIRDDTSAARKLFDFLGVELHRNVVGFCEAQQNRRAPSALSGGPTRDISTDPAISDWGRVLTPDQRLRSLELLGTHLIRYGYETEASLAKARRELMVLQQGI
jgi:hypothetical protein